MEAYNSLWPAKFLQIRANAIEQFPDWTTFTIEHIGGTAVPGLPAEPVIDILVATTPEQIDEAATSMTKNGLYVRRDDPRHPHCSLFTASDAATPHTILLCLAPSLPARANIAIRDTLRSDSELRTYYINTENRAAEDNIENADATFLKAYRDVQTPVLHHILIASQRFSTQELAVLFNSTLSSRWPPITTPRLLLREYEVADTECMYALESNPDNARYQSWHPWTRIEARKNVLREMLRSYDDGRAVVELAVLCEGEFVGRIGAAVRRLTCLDADGPEDGRDGVKGARPAKHVDLWFSFLPASQGKGLATEAMRAFIDELVKKIKTGGEGLEMEIECDPRNAGSWRLAERLGFEQVSLVERAWECKGEWVGSKVLRRIV